jgi:pyruvate,water dikinase
VLLSGQGSHAETTVVEDLWRLSRNEITLTEFLADHGYHGPGEGELSSWVWREDPTPIRALAQQYRTRPDDERPELSHAQRAARRAEAVRELLAGLSAPGRVQARLALRLADRMIPLRGVGKVAFLQSFDVVRAAARRIGEHLTHLAVLDNPDDVFLLESSELTSAASRGRLQEQVELRRKIRDRHQQLTLPGSWRGRPVVTQREQPEQCEVDTRIEAVGASPGIVEGHARVVLDPVDAHVEDGEILVAHTTDPSWASIMFVSAGLVVDIGNLLSHAAVVARELGIPCVMGTQDGTRRIRSGDVIRIDGHAGTVEILRRA